MRWRLTRSTRARSPVRSLRRSADPAMIQVMLPAHLRTLAKTDRVVQLEVEGQVTQRAVLDALETAYPTLRGTIRDTVTRQRRPLVRFFAGKQDLSHEPPDALLPTAVAAGDEPFMVIGAMAGG